MEIWKDACFRLAGRGGDRWERTRKAVSDIRKNPPLERALALIKIVESGTDVRIITDAYMSGIPFSDLFRGRSINTPMVWDAIAELSALKL